MKHCTLLSLLHQYMKNTTASQRCMLLYACLNIVHCFFWFFSFFLTVQHRIPLDLFPCHFWPASCFGHSFRMPLPVGRRTLSCAAV